MISVILTVLHLTTIERIHNDGTLTIVMSPTPKPYFPGPFAVWKNRGEVYACLTPAFAPENRTRAVIARYANAAPSDEISTEGDAEIFDLCSKGLSYLVPRLSVDLLVRPPFYIQYRTGLRVLKNRLSKSA